MRWGLTTEQRNMRRLRRLYRVKVFAWLPVKLHTGRYAWLENVRKTHWSQLPFMYSGWRFEPVQENERYPDWMIQLNKMFGGKK